MDRQIFNGGFALLMKTYGKVLESDVVEIYWSIMKGMSNENFKNTITNIIKTFYPTSQCPFPVPANFINSSGMSDRDSGRVAIAEVKKAGEKIGAYESINFNDNALHLTICAFGGWPTIARWTDEDWKINERRFEETYEAYRRRGAKGPDILPGIHEINNNAIKMNDFTKPPTKICGDDLMQATKELE